MADGSIKIDTKIDQKGIDSGVKTMKSKLNGAAGKLKGAGKKMSAAFTAPIIGLGGVAFKAADDVDKAYRNIRVGTGKTGAALDELKEQFEEVFVNVPDSAEAVSNALSTLNTLTGASGDVLGELTQNVLDASRTLGEDGVGNASAFGKAMEQWQIPAEEGVGKLDKLYKVTQDYGVGLGEISSHLTEYGSVLSNAGFNMDESAELFGRLEKGGISVSRIMPGLNMAFRNWASEGKNSREEFDKTIKAMQETGTETEALAIATEAFGAEGAQRLTTGVRTGAIPALDELGKSMEGSSGLIKETTEETRTVGEEFGILKNQAMTQLEPLGKILLDLAKEYVPPLIEGVKNIAEWFQNLSPTTLKVIGIVTGLIAILGPLLVLISIMITTLTTILPIITAVGSALALIFSPIGLIIAAVVALVAVIVIYWEQIWEVTKTVFGAIGSFFVSTWDGIKAAITIAVNMIKAIISTVWNSIKSITESVFGGIKSFFSSIWGGIQSGAEKFKTVFLGIWDAIKAGIRAVVNPISGIINGLLGGIESMINAISRAINSLPSFDIPSWVPVVGGKTFGLPDIPSISIPKIPSLDVGTDFVSKDGLAMIHKGEKIVPAEHNGPYKGGGGITIENVFNIDGEEAFRIIEPYVDTSLGDKVTLENYLRGE